MSVLVKIKKQLHKVGIFGKQKYTQKLNGLTAKIEVQKKGDWK
jgi:hypothetical protein